MLKIYFHCFFELALAMRQMLQHFIRCWSVGLPPTLFNVPPVPAVFELKEEVLEQILKHARE